MDYKKVFRRGKFGWQAGYAAFSYSHSQIDSVVKYIMNQEEHHKKKTLEKNISRCYSDSI